jgi:anthranilate phosphoribosyltransferase
MASSSLDPTSLGLPRAQIDDIQGGGPAENATIARRVLGGERGPHRDIVALNASAALVVAGSTASLAEGLTIAGEVLDDGRAAATLDRLVAVSGAHLPG